MISLNDILNESSVRQLCVDLKQVGKLWINYVLFNQDFKNDDKCPCIFIKQTDFF
ncbi:hypothetical protein Mapa_010796 [Marchantia paleacea]|nr:hypothetical protein Mapa_010796 [Marchantia paleacea]